MLSCDVRYALTTNFGLILLVPWLSCRHRRREILSIGCSFDPI